MNSKLVKYWIHRYPYHGSPMQLRFIVSIVSLSTAFTRAVSATNTSASFISIAGSGQIHSHVTRPKMSLATLTTDTNNMTVDIEYPGTAVERMMAVRARVSELNDGTLNQKWEEVRRKLLWAGGLRDLQNAIPGRGYTGHSFNDFNHVDLTTMLDQVSDSKNDGAVKGIAIGNHLGDGIRIASIPELGPGGSWSTCALGCSKDPPQDVAHIQFRSRIAFKLVWVPNQDYDTFVLVDDDGKLLAKGTPSDGPAGLPALRERVLNYRLVEGSKYAVEADKIAGLK